MSKRQQISGGPPWWLWLLMVIVGIGILAKVVIGFLPTNSDELVEELLASMDSGNLKRVKELLPQVRETPGLEGYASYTEGVISSVERRHVRALEHFDEALKSDVLRGRVLLGRGRSLQALGRYDEAIEVMNSALAAEPDLNIARISLASLYNNFGAYALSLEASEAALAAEPANSDAQRLVADACLSMEDHARFVKNFEPIMEQNAAIDTVSPETLNGFVSSMTHVGRAGDAIAALDGHVEALTDPRVQMRVLADAEEFTELRSAIEYVRRTASETQSGPDALEAAIYGDARIAVHEGDWNEAWKRAMEMAPSRSREIHVLELLRQIAEKGDRPEDLAWVQQNLDQLQDLKSEYEELRAATAKNINDVDARLELIDMCIRLGDWKAAIRYLQAAELLAPEKVDRGAIERRIFEGYAGFLVPRPGSEEASADEASAGGAAALARPGVTVQLPNGSDQPAEGTQEAGKDESPSADSAPESSATEKAPPADSPEGAGTDQER